MYKVMIIEDDATIARVVQEHLRRWDYTVHCITDFRNIVEQVAQYEPHLVLLDITLPFFNGFHWCNEVRKVSKVPIVFVSSAADNMNIVMAVNMGGDDFIAKPFDLNVLTAKVQAVLRRTYSFHEQVNHIVRGGALLNLGDASLTYQGRRLDLTKNDYKILRILMEHAGKVVSRNSIMEQLWQSDSFIDDNTLTVNINRLRKKLSDAGLTDYIKTKKGLGYWIE